VPAEKDENMNTGIRVNEKVELLKPTMIIGLDGWGNAGKVSTFTVKYLVDKLGAKRFGEIPHERFHDYFIQRPLVSTKQGLVQSYTPPSNELFYWKGKKGENDLVLLLGFEPHHDWPRYARTVLGLAKRYRVKRIYTIGGYLADISHTDESLITSSTNNSKILKELEKAGIELTDYNGPTSIYSELLWRSREKKIDVVSLWVAVPIYVEGAYPKAAYDMLRKLLELTNIRLDLSDLKTRAEIFEKEAMSQPSGVIYDLERRRKGEEKTTYIS